MLQIFGAIQKFCYQERHLLLSGFQVDICSLTLILKLYLMRFPVSTGISFTLHMIDVQGNISSGETVRIHKLMGDDHATEQFIFLEEVGIKLNKIQNTTLFVRDMCMSQSLLHCLFLSYYSQETENSRLFIAPIM